MEICTLASGSRGNCTYVAGERTSVLVDMGLTIKELLVRAAAEGIDIKRVQAILVTHEHIDHIKGVAALARKLNVPVYASPVIREAMEARLGILRTFVESVGFDTGFSLNELDIQPFRVPHDAAYTVGYKISENQRSFGLATDLGQMNDAIFGHLKTCDTVLLESNHDVDMLKNGSYPYYLKRRIMGLNGHLSNEDCADCAVKLVEAGVKKLILGHLSQENNTPEVAFSTVNAQLLHHKMLEGKDVDVVVATQWKASEKIVI